MNITKKLTVLTIATLLYISHIHPARIDPVLGFNKVVIWGHKLHTHTHSYIHWGLYRAFQHLGYTTYWFDNNDNVRMFDFSNSLFITEWHVDQKMPLRKDCFYIIHNLNEGNREKKYKQQIRSKHCISLRVDRGNLNRPTIKKTNNHVYHDIVNKSIYTLWATDLLPHEIDGIKKQLPLKPQSNTVYYIGTVDTGNLPEVAPFQRACKENDIAFIHQGGYGDNDVALNKVKISREQNINYIQSSIMAPAILRAEHCRTSYIPCRIFKNISYGQFGITNSKAVYELFDKKIIYNPDTYQLFFDAKQKLKQVTLEQQYELMDFVRDHHTYINRVQELLSFFYLIYTR